MGLDLILRVLSSCILSEDVKTVVERSIANGADRNVLFETS